MSPETELVLALCRTALSDDARRRASVLLAQPVDWGLVLGLAADWEMEPVVFLNLRSFPPGSVPEDVLQLARNRERESRAHAIARTLVTVDLAKYLERDGISVIVLKGPAVGVSAYGDPSLRSFADVDLLLRREDLHRARDMLLSRGYSADYNPSAEQTLVRDQHALEFSRANTKVELHWSLIERHLHLNVDPAELWNLARSVPCAGGVIRILAPHHLFLFVCAHGTKHQWERPRWICDVAQLGQRLNAENVAALLDLAARNHARRIIALGDRLARSIFSDYASPFSRDVAVTEADTAPLVEMTRARIGLNGSSPLAPRGMLERLDAAMVPVMFWSRCRERAIDRAACIFSVLFLPTEKDRGGPVPPWVRRPVRLAARAIRRSATA